MLRLIETGKLQRAPLLKDPIGSLRAISADLTCRGPVAMLDKPDETPISIQRWYLEQCEAMKGLDDPDLDVMRRWREILDDLDADPIRTADRVDWATKWRFLLNPTIEKHGTNWKDVGVWGDILKKS